MHSFLTKRLSLRVLAFFLFVAGIALLAIPSRAADLALVHAKIYLSPDAPPIEDGTILIHKGRIRAVGPSNHTKILRLIRRTTVIDCHGKVITAGFWNSHVHVLTPVLLHSELRSNDVVSSELDQMFTRWGFTTVFDIASILNNTNAVRRRIARGEVRGPRILTVGDPFFPKNGTPIYVRDLWRREKLPSDEIQSIPQAVAREKRQLAAGADGVKLFTGASEANGIVPMPVDAAKALVAEAHRAGKPVFAHPGNSEGIEIALGSGVDILAHTTPDGSDWTPELIARLKSAHMALIPTLTLWDVEAKRQNLPDGVRKSFIDNGVRQLQAYSQAGGLVLFGTDAGYISDYDTAEEFQLMAQAGLTFPQILASMTTNPAGRFGYARRSGRIAKGMDADLVVLAADPAKDITALARIDRVVRAGRVVYPTY
ncbi:amidohydrolase family protein [Acidicapsa dinghuensis]|uniref:Amidohydrolase family protein n=1 Tax=Acidicapsa dinghuensis TaxID=2218256 RepID=A0ABW1EEJ2_9BACT|nr:amidohydrolase family protein [Acidicapsa dinghuensis]